MEVLIACNTFVVGLLIGSLVMDWRTRKKDAALLVAEREKVTAAFAAITATVNPLTMGMQDLRDRVSAGEMRAAQGNRATPMGARG